MAPNSFPLAVGFEKMSIYSVFVWGFVYFMQVLQKNMIFFVKIVANDKDSLYNINKTMQMFLCKFVYTRSE